MDYPQYNKMAKLLGSSGVTVKNSVFGAQVALKVVVRQEDAAGFEATITALTAGTVNPEKTGQAHVPVSELPVPGL
jgi:putative IMPACT (imprinted ancient) family translation regulator